VEESAGERDLMGQRSRMGVRETGDVLSGSDDGTRTDEGGRWSRRRNRRHWEREWRHFGDDREDGATRACWTL
jgi:hypothetical protein